MYANVRIYSGFLKTIYLVEEHNQIIRSNHWFCMFLIMPGPFERLDFLDFAVGGASKLSRFFSIGIGFPYIRCKFELNPCHFFSSLSFNHISGRSRGRSGWSGGWRQDPLCEKNHFCTLQCKNNCCCTSAAEGSSFLAAWVIKERGKRK